MSARPKLLVNIFVFLIFPIIVASLYLWSDLDTGNIMMLVLAVTNALLVYDARRKDDGERDFKRVFGTWAIQVKNEFSHARSSDDPTVWQAVDKIRDLISGFDTMLAEAEDRWGKEVASEIRREIKQYENKLEQLRGVTVSRRDSQIGADGRTYYPEQSEADKAIKYEQPGDDFSRDIEQITERIKEKIKAQ